MSISIKHLFYTLFASTFIAGGLAFAKECGESKADLKCQEMFLNDTTIMVNGKYSDPGHAKVKEARRMCCYEKARDPKKFAEKYGTD